MNALKKQSCWEIMQCDDKVLCPVRQNGQTCWEWMVQNKQFQCQYGLCEECIVYLYNNENTVFSNNEIEEIMHKRQLVQPMM